MTAAVTDLQSVGFIIRIEQQTPRKVPNGGIEGRGGGGGGRGSGGCKSRCQRPFTESTRANHVMDICARVKGIDTSVRKPSRCAPSHDKDGVL